MNFCLGFRKSFAQQSVLSLWITQFFCISVIFKTSSHHGFWSKIRFYGANFEINICAKILIDFGFMKMKRAEHKQGMRIICNS